MLCPHQWIPLDSKRTWSSVDLSPQIAFPRHESWHPAQPAGLFLSSFPSRKVRTTAAYEVLPWWYSSYQKRFWISVVQSTVKNPLLNFKKCFLNLSMVEPRFQQRHVTERKVKETILGFIHHPNSCNPTDARSQRSCSKSHGEASEFLFWQIYSPVHHVRGEIRVSYESPSVHE